MQKEVVYGLGGLAIGVLVSVFVASSAVNSGNTKMMRMIGMNTERMEKEMGEHRMMRMDEMVEELKDKTGDEFDKTFVSLMIEHHEGAIDMAEEATKNAKHQEIKDLADSIIEAQTKEINQMKNWQKTWGY